MRIYAPEGEMILKFNIYFTIGNLALYSLIKNYFQPEHNDNSSRPISSEYNFDDAASATRCQIVLGKAEFGDSLKISYKSEQFQSVHLCNHERACDVKEYGMKSEKNICSVQLDLSKG